MKKLFTKNSIESEIGLFSSKPESFWEKNAQKRTLKLFHEAANRVPAYKDFLHKNRINPRLVKTISDFVQVPYVDKQNYLKVYPLDKLVWDGNLPRLSMMSRSSGSSGEPFYWPRGDEQESEVSYIYEIIYRSFFQMHKRKTLVIVGYAMGTWVAGTYTLTTGLKFANQPQPVTFVTPGNNPKEIIELAMGLGPYYDQVVLCGYPPFIKEVIDIGGHEGVDWASINLKYIMGAETFSESFRDFLLSAAGSKNPLRDSMNTIGSADAGILGHETPLSIAIRRRASVHSALWDDLFPSNRVPTLAQYYPWLKYFESIENQELLFSSNGGIPLLRYNIHDHGEIVAYSDMNQLLLRHEMNAAELVEGEKDCNLNWTLPFISIYGKSDNTLPFYGAKVYPENIHVALEDSIRAKAVTGKFKMSVTQNSAFVPSLVIDVELSPGAISSSTLQRQLGAHTFTTLKRVNSEFASVVTGIGKEKAFPLVNLHPFASLIFRDNNIKHRWVQPLEKA